MRIKRTRILETTGLADPARWLRLFVDDDIVDKYKLDGIITVADAKHITQHLDEEKPEGVENESVEQIAFTDRIMLNKITSFQRRACRGRKQNQVDKQVRTNVSHQNNHRSGESDQHRIIRPRRPWRWIKFLDLPKPSTSMMTG